MTYSYKPIILNVGKKIKQINVNIYQHLNLNSVLINLKRQQQRINKKSIPIGFDLNVVYIHIYIMRIFLLIQTERVATSKKSIGQSITRGTISRKKNNDYCFFICH